MRQTVSKWSGGNSEPRNTDHGDMRGSGDSKSVPYNGRETAVDGSDMLLVDQLWMWVLGGDGRFSTLKSPSYVVNIFISLDQA